MSAARSRALNFWLLHLGGWFCYFGFNFLIALGHGKPFHYITVSATTALAGMIVTLLLRFFLRAIWQLAPLSFALAAALPLLACAITMSGAFVFALNSYCGADCPPRNLFGYVASSSSFLWVVLAWTGLYFGIKKQEQSKADRERALEAIARAHEAQLKMLRYQLNPHFLFNTLNAISTLILDQQPETANRMVTRLSGFLRLSLDNDPVQRVTLGQELDALRLYLDIEQLRFAERLRVRMEVAPGCASALVPSLLLQPLVENAVKYAVAPRIEGGSIEVRAKRAGTRLLIEMCDDGPGMNGAKPDGGLGVGLANARERLRVIYGEQQSFQIADAEPHGCCIRIELPFEIAAGTLS